ncbi:Neuropeptide Y receptor [Armadillidium nasatum]|uniref:Neuropeptide Y receptor n=1 Tax=Armadillidium nasatum TaxID=96803 RepID=A0A5N5SMP8_9CRUS|nr:Neuropeptide Y receptor [Armadillidium nasatum]
MTSIEEYRLNILYHLDEEDQNLIEKVVLSCQNFTTNYSLFHNETANVLEYLSYSCNFCEEQDIDRLWALKVCDMPSRTIFNICVYVLYITILIVAVIGNLLVVYVVWGTSKLRTVTNYFIVNLAIGDLFMAFFCVPFSFLSTLILQYWPFGFYLCIIVNYFQAVSVFVSAYTLVAISIDRYLAIIYPLRPRMTRLKSKLIILVVWILSLTTTLPVAIFSDLMEPSVNFYRIYNLKVCQEDWSQFKQEAGAIYSSALMLLQYFLPLTVLIFTYLRIAIVVWGKKDLGETPARIDRLAKGKKKCPMVCLFLA